jgi:hypothetical protein
MHVETLALGIRSESDGCAGAGKAGNKFESRNKKLETNSDFGF